jgi:hypothetical protein
MKLIPYFIRDPDFRYRLETLRGGYMKECLKREIMSHRRLVFQSRVRSKPAAGAGVDTAQTVLLSARDADPAAAS